MNTTVVYPVGVGEALGHLNGSRNDVEIFVEDTANINMWRTLLRNFLPEGVAFNDPIPLGGRRRVLEECRADQGDDGRRKLYIIDADMDILYGRAKPRLKHLYRLRAYCVENYLIHERGLVELAQLLNVDVSTADAEDQLDFPSWVQNLEGLFARLFVMFGVSRLLRPEIKTVSLHFSRFCPNGAQADQLCEASVSRYSYQVLRELRRTHTKEEVAASIAAVSENVRKFSFLSYASGKSYILPLLMVRMRRVFGPGLNVEQAKVALAREVGQNVDPYLTKRLRKLCQ
ncbi:DUF4435 domain-containing protein [Salipiger bermudensis]|uniref:DUF4435 domain-containing protein n=1 Tax=Salipiger bermudensis TaxID=344736 RepID=UPI000A052784|nr:DUF4435 domain-containing protein [Salipiger bermudensis]